MVSQLWHALVTTSMPPTESGGPDALVVALAGGLGALIGSLIGGGVQVWRDSVREAATDRRRREDEESRRREEARKVRAEVYLSVIQTLSGWQRKLRSMEFFGQLLSDMPSEMWVEGLRTSQTELAEMIEAENDDLVAKVTVYGSKATRERLQSEVEQHIVWIDSNPAFVLHQPTEEVMKEVRGTGRSDALDATARPMTMEEISHTGALAASTADYLESFLDHVRSEVHLDD